MRKSFCYCAGQSLNTFNETIVFALVNINEAVQYLNDIIYKLYML